MNKLCALGYVNVRVAGWFICIANALCSLTRNRAVAVVSGVRVGDRKPYETVFDDATLERERGAGVAQGRNSLGFRGLRAPSDLIKS